MGFNGCRRATDPAGTGRADPAGGAGQRDAQRRYQHADLRLTREPGDKRTGTFTSGIVSMVGAWTIALFFTGWKHAGENIAEVLKKRAPGLPAPIQMCDAVSRHTP